MKSVEVGHVIRAWTQAVCRGNPLDTRHIRLQLDIHAVETIAGEQRCLTVKERVISYGRKAVDFSLSDQSCCSKASVIS